MSTASTRNHDQAAEPAFGHAVVIGSSIAGLTSARVLIDHFARVTIIERDRLPDTAEFRSGAPQARHVHVLRLAGQRILEQQFPGLVDELLAGGAEAVNAGNEAEFFLFGRWRGPRYRSKIVSVSSSRPLLESTIYRRLAVHPRVSVIQEHDVVGLMADEAGARVTGVRLRHRGESSAPVTELAADLVVDASGRGSKAPLWLEELDFTPPRETVIDAFPGYTSRLYRRPAGAQQGWKTMYIIPTPPNSPRGGVIVPIEGDRWLVTLIGMGGDYPPADEAGFLAFARSLPSLRFYEAIRNAEPLTEPYGFRRNENRLRHYDQLPRYLEGFLVIGDGVGAMNPIHAQGMTVSAMASLALGQCLAAQRRQPVKPLAGLAETFQKALSRVVAGPWHMATSIDRRWPATVGADEPLAWTARLRQKYFTLVIRAMVHDPQVAEAFFHVQHMVAPAKTLYRPAVVLRVLASALRRRRPPVVLRPGKPGLYKS